MLGPRLQRQYDGRRVELGLLLGRPGRKEVLILTQPFSALRYVRSMRSALAAPINDSEAPWSETVRKARFIAAVCVLRIDCPNVEEQFRDSWPSRPRVDVFRSCHPA